MAKKLQREGGKTEHLLFHFINEHSQFQLASTKIHNYESKYQTLVMLCSNICNSSHKNLAYSNPIG
jgi:hypothetical protein